MGMFDTLVVEYPLPDADAVAEIKEWQTKSFDYPALENYRITATGQLLRERRRIGESRVKHLGWKKTHFSGILEFYEVLDGVWFEYDAEFVGGQIVSIKRAKQQ